MALAGDLAGLALVLWCLQSFTYPDADTMTPVATPQDHYYSSGDTLDFAGYKWVTKESNDRHTGPGRNYFAGGKENAWVDEQGRLHLRMTNRHGRWYCAEAKLLKSLGYGLYRFRVEANPMKLDKNIVVGFFTYDHSDTVNHHREIDLEFSTWGKESDLNSQYVVQPADVPENVKRFSTDLSRSTVHTIDWKKNRICFHSRYADADNSAGYFTWMYKPDQGLRQHEEKFSINIWLDNTDFPSNHSDYEIVVSKFEFTKKKFPASQ